MTELTTGVLLLISSLYGSGHADMHAINIANAQSKTPKQVIEEKIQLADNGISVNNIDPKIMEEYLRIVYADTPILVDIARCESNFKQFDSAGNLIRGIKNNSDVGVMQINERYHSDTAKALGINLHTIAGNIEYAKHLYDEQGAKPWSASQKCWGNTSNDVAKK